MSDSYKVMHDMPSDNNNIIVAGGRLPPITRTALSSHVEDMVSSGLVSSSSSTDDDSPTKVVTRREMILALIARSEVKEAEKDPESEENNKNDVGGEHQHRDRTSDAQVEDEEDVKDGSANTANHDAGERKKWSWGSYLKFVTPIQDEDLAGNQARARCNLCNKIYLRSFIRMHIHRHRHGNPGSRKTPCNICGELIQQQNLKRHKRRVHPNGETVKPLERRYLKFATPIDDLKYSAKVKCNLCNRNMTRAYISKHIQSVHGFKVKCDNGYNNPSC